jgi:hypothetical protein
LEQSVTPHGVSSISVAVMIVALSMTPPPNFRS